MYDDVRDGKKQCLAHAWNCRSLVKIDNDVIGTNINILALQTSNEIVVFIIDITVSDLTSFVFQLNSGSHQPTRLQRSLCQKLPDAKLHCEIMFFNQHL
mmetsp:Transcript_3569/g.5636  ORF Transcript_3569/g.5636 Transcript_3569/m.5636 type:complete len:99 (+) Transcript_3569:1467-1763(+)